MKKFSLNNSFKEIDKYIRLINTKGCKMCKKRVIERERETEREQAPGCSN